MIKIPSNFRGKEKKDEMCPAGCDKIETMEHIYKCIEFNKGKKVIHPYEKIYNGHISEQVEIFNIMKRNLEKRKILLSNNK